MITSPSLIDKFKILVEKNFCEKCFKKYIALIEPEIEYLLSEPISDWRETEENITQMFLKDKGYFKQTEKGTLHLDLHEEDLQNIRNSPLKRKIDYLRKQGILKENFYKFLDYVRSRRNKIHPPNKFSNQDYMLFKQAKELTDVISTTIMFDLKDDVYERLLVKAENYAKQVLSKLSL